jgi:hypothetical protein
MWVSVANDYWLSTRRRKSTSRRHRSSCCATAPTWRANLLGCAGGAGAVRAMSTRCFELTLNPSSLLSPATGQGPPSTSGAAQVSERGQTSISNVTCLSSLALPPLSVPSSLTEFSSSTSLPFPLSGSATSVMLAISWQVREETAHPMPLPLALWAQISLHRGMQSQS